MKIHIDASRALDPQPTGVNIYAQEIIDHLVSLDSGDEIILYAPAWSRGREKIVFPELKKVTWKFLRWPPKFLWTQICLAFAWARADKREAVFFAPAHVAPFFSPKNLVVVIHDIAFEFLPEAFSARERLFARVMTRMNARVAKKIIVPSNETKKQLISLLKITSEKIFVTPFALPCSTRVHAEATPISRPPFILSVGRIEYKKGVDILVRAFDKLRAGGSEIELVLVGKPGIGYEQIKKNIAASPFRKYIHELGFVSDAELAGLYGAARALALPTRYEGFGFNFLEGMARGVPVVGMNRGSVGEVAGDGALIAETENEFSKMLADVISNDELRLSLVIRGGEQVKKFSWGKTATETHKILVVDKR
jgi:glycosyltransferase involved in cell wall biosynthesis